MKNRGKAINLRYRLIDEIKLVKEFGLGLHVLNGDLQYFLKTGYEEGVIPNLHLRIVGGFREVEYYPTTEKYFSREQGEKSINGTFKYPELSGYGILSAIGVALYDNVFREDENEEYESEWHFICASG